MNSRMLSLDFRKSFGGCQLISVHEAAVVLHDDPAAGAGLLCYTHELKNTQMLTRFSNECRSETSKPELRYLLQPCNKKSSSYSNYFYRKNVFLLAFQKLMTYFWMMKTA